MSPPRVKSVFPVPSETVSDASGPRAIVAQAVAESIDAEGVPKLKVGVRLEVGGEELVRLNEDWAGVVDVKASVLFRR